MVGGDEAAVPASSTFTRNATSSYAARIVVGLSALILTPYLYRRLGADGFGTWSVIFTVTTVFGLLELGFSGGVAKVVAELRGRRAHSEVQSTLGNALVLTAMLGLVAAGISAAIAFGAPGLAAESQEDEFTAGLLILGGAMLLRFPCAAYGAVLMGYQRFDFFNASVAVTTLGFAAGAVIAVETGNGVLGLSVAYAAAAVAGGLVYAVGLRRVDRALSLRPRLGDATARRHLLGFSSFTLLSDSMVFIGQRMDVVIIAALRGAAASAPFAAALKLQTALQSLTLPFVELLMPMVSELWAGGQTREVARRFMLATRVALQITLPVALALIFFARDIVDIWLGAVADDATASIVVVLVCVQVVILGIVPAEKVLIGIGRVRLVGALAVVEGVANVGVSIALVSAYGAIGAAVGTLVTTGLLAPIKLPIAARAVGIPLGRLLQESFGRAAASSLASLILMAGIWALLEPGLARLILGSAVGIGAAAAVALVQIGPARVASVLQSRRAPAQTSLPSLGAES